MAKVSMIVESGLTDEERTKFDRLEPALANLFISHGKTFRVCSGYGEGVGRLVVFLSSIPKENISLPASQFVSLPDAELLKSIETVISGKQV